MRLAADPRQALARQRQGLQRPSARVLGIPEQRPLFVEMSFVDLQGRERVKVTTGRSCRRAAGREPSGGTFLKAERYWPELKKLKPGEIYVSEVIGAYVGSRVIGAYLPASARKAGVEFKPEESAYAGTENPVGKRFRAIVRWATPVVGRQGVGLRDAGPRPRPHPPVHRPHQPDGSRYTDQRRHRRQLRLHVGSPSRAISHPRDYFIPGYDPPPASR
jgi:hypothetical protein